MTNFTQVFSLVDLETVVRRFRQWTPEDMLSAFKELPTTPKNVFQLSRKFASPVRLPITVQGVPVKAFRLRGFFFTAQGLTAIFSCDVAPEGKRMCYVRWNGKDYDGSFTKEKI